MSNIQFIITVVILATASIVALFLYHRKKRKDSSIELNCEFCISENTDTLLDTYKKQTGVSIDGILGNDFMVRHDYIIDYESLTVRHKSVKISIKDAMGILEVPLIMLYQDNRKYIFMLDTGATGSLLHSKHLEDGFDFESNEGDEAQIFGFGGSGMSSKTVNAKLRYYQTKRKYK